MKSFWKSSCVVTKTTQSRWPPIGLSKNGVSSSATYPPPARISIACSMTPRSFRSTDKAIGSSQKLNNARRTALRIPRSGRACHLFPRTPRMLFLQSGSEFYHCNLRWRANTQSRSELRWTKTHAKDDSRNQQLSRIIRTTTTGDASGRVSHDPYSFRSSLSSRLLRTPYSWRRLLVVHTAGTGIYLAAVGEANRAVLWHFETPYRRTARRQNRQATSGLGSASYF